MSVTLSQQLARFAVGLRLEELPGPVVEMARKCLLDWMGSVLAGSTQPPAAMARRYLEVLGGRPQASLFGTGLRTGVGQAAFGNGLAAHIVEMDDLHRPSTLHAAAPVISAAVACAEQAGASGRRLLEAVVVGYEVACRIAEAVNPSHYRFWHNTATCGTFGAAAAAAKVLGLGEEAFAHALGSAGSQAAGLWEFMRDGAMTKHLHTGQAALNGVTAAYLAREGFTGASAILEGEKGFFRAMAQEADPSRVTDGLGSRFAILENSFKLYPCCGHTHSAVAAALWLRQAYGLQASRIRQVEVRTYRAALEVAGHTEPRTPYEAKFSLVYTVAAALARGRLGLEEFDPEALQDPQVEQVRRCTRAGWEAACEQAYPRRWMAVVEVELADGQRLQHRVDRVPGEDGAAVSMQELEGKFRSMLRWACSRAPQSARHLTALEEFPALVQRMEELPDLGELSRLALAA
ncbi:MAG TPA: MmgE/PrpD family protein [Limnochordales bacterium]